MKRLCVFAGSNPGRRDEYREMAALLGRALASRGIGLVYGGARIGLMGAVADAALASGGEVIGVIPEQLVAKEVAHAGLTELCVVGSMHERKRVMSELSDGFIAVPGGLGTIEEFAEVLTWAQLGLHRKPVGLLNVAGYFARLVEFFDHSVAERFLVPAHRSMVLVGSTPDEVLQRMAEYRPQAVEKWLDRDAS